MELRMGMKKKPIKKKVAAVYEESKEVLPEESDISIMEDSNPDEMQIVWVDSQVNSKINKKNQEEIQKCSNIKLICYEKSEEVRNLMNKPEMERDIILISGGRVYKEIKELVEKSKKVRMIIIFDPKSNTLKAFEEHSKVITVTDSYSQIENILKNLESYFYSQLVRFDPQVNMKDNNHLQKSSEKHLICIDNPEGMKKLINNPKTIHNIVLVPSGDHYKEIREVVENSSIIRMVIIFCNEPAHHMHYKTEHNKVWDVVDSIQKVIESLREYHSIKHSKK